jgi:hypothetical protein
MGTTAHCYAVVGGSILCGCADYIISAYPNRDPALNNRLALRAIKHAENDANDGRHYLFRGDYLLHTVNTVDSGERD